MLSGEGWNPISLECSLFLRLPSHVHMGGEPGDEANWTVLVDSISIINCTHTCRGVLARSLVQAQAASPTFTHVYAALVSIINTKFPQTGELIAKRLLIQFRRGFRRNNKVHMGTCTVCIHYIIVSPMLPYQPIPLTSPQSICVSAVKFLAHLVNQQVLHELVALEMLTLLLEEPTDDTVEVSIGFLKDCGQKLTEVGL